VLRHQLIVLRRKVRGRAQLTNDDRWFFLQMYRWFPSILKVVTIVQPDTLVRWHRVGFRRYSRFHGAATSRTLPACHCAANGSARNSFEPVTRSALAA
jgi:hypothetical protein